MEYQYRAVPNASQDLQHHGVKGMHWGVRKRRSLSISTAPRPTNLQVKAARANVRATNQAGRKQIRGIKKNADLTKNQKKAQIKDVRASLLKNPDRLTASRMTHGDKIIVGIMAATAPPTAAAMVASHALGIKIIKSQLAKG